MYLLARSQAHEALKLVLVMATAKLDAASNAAKLAAAGPDAKKNAAPGTQASY